MSILTAVLDPVREFFTLSAAERGLRAYVPEQYARVRGHLDAADLRLSAGRQVTQAAPAALLLRSSVEQYLLAAEASRDARADGSMEAARAAMPELPPAPDRPRAQPSDDARVRAALAARDGLYFDDLSPEDAERCRRALDRAAVLLRGRLETRTLIAVRATRSGRLAALALVAIYAAVTLVRACALPRNIARGKPVHPSSLKHNPPLGSELVEGAMGASFGVHTGTEDEPSVVIDLLGEYWIDTVKVHNRTDGWFDDCLPLVLEVSRDGRAYVEVSRRETHFDADPPWTVGVGGRPGRYVRLRVARSGYLALREVEVFGSLR